jgi:hypothetical protein
LNDLLKREGLPLRVEAMSTVWTVLYDVPSRFNWLLQFYLRREGIALSWVGTGRLIFSLNFTDADFDDFCQRFVRAGTSDGCRCLVVDAARADKQTNSTPYVVRDGAAD